MKPLGEIVKILKGGKAPEVYNEPRPGAYPYLQIEDLRPDATPKYAIDNDGTLATKADVLIAWDGANAGTVGFDLEGYIGSTIAILRPIHNDIYAPYLGYFLRSKFSEIQENTTGATIPHVNRGYLENLLLLIPPLPEQRRIAALLGRADHLRRLRHYADALSASLLPSVFLEMFGNGSRWEKNELGDLIDRFEAGVNYLPVAEGKNSSEWRVLKISAVTWGDFDPTESKPISIEVEFDESHIVRQGDLLISRANTTELVGAVSLVRTIPPKVLLPDKLWRIRFRDNSAILPEYTLYALRQPSMRKIIGDLATGSSGSMKNISMEKAATLPIPIPPLPEQERFARVVRRVEALRRRQAEAARQGEALFQALLVQSFGSA